jgi:hypothetical protein
MICRAENGIHLSLIFLSGLSHTYSGFLAVDSFDIEAGRILIPHLGVVNFFRIVDGLIL